jgi:hypothetical protein
MKNEKKRESHKPGDINQTSPINLLAMLVLGRTG